jgi:hypothetical protein
VTESTTLEGQATSAPARPTRKRGVGFPVVDLHEAVSILRKTGKFGTDFALEAFAGFMGHSTANSGSFKRRIAAFKDWQFIAGGTGDRVVFTDLGRRLAFPTDPDNEKRDLMEAFQNCDIFMRVHENSAKGIPISMEALANLAVRQLGVAPVSKDRFANSLSKSAVTAGFAWMEGDKICFVGPTNDETVQDPKAAEDQGGVKGIWVPEDRIDELNLGVGHDAHATTIEPEEDPSFPTRRRSGTSELPGPWAGGLTRTTPMGDPMWRDRPVGKPPDARVNRIVSAPGGTSEGEPMVAGRDMRVTGSPEKPATLFQQSWDFKVGNLVFEIKSSQSLPGSAFTQIGKVLTEIEKLKDMLAEESGGSQRPSKSEQSVDPDSIRLPR